MDKSKTMRVDRVVESVSNEEVASKNKVKVEIKYLAYDWIKVVRKVENWRNSREKSNWRDEDWLKVES